MALLAIVLALAVIGLLDHYPWTILHLQVAWWGAQAVAGQTQSQVAVNASTA